ncbi:MAG: hypothetical protein WD066_14950 [Planctomycetaceae bacterium]
MLIQLRRRPAVIDFGLLVYLSSIALGGGFSPSGVEAQEPSAKQAVPARAVAAFPEDRSLTDVEYIRRGVPAHDRVWSAGDLQSALKALSEIAAQDPGLLPRFDSKRSGATFGRMTAAENLELLKDRSLPLAVRMPMGIATLETTGELTKLYLDGFARNAIGGVEMVELMGIMFRSAEAVVVLVDEFLPTLPPDDPDREVRQAGLEQMKRGMGTMIAGGLTTLTEDGFSTADRIRLAGYLRETVPTIAGSLSKASQSEILRRLDDMTRDPKLKEVHPAIDELRKAVREKVEPAEQPPR